MNKPLISVLISTYNNEKFLKNSIESIINQTYRNFELLIIDDGSNDNTKKILKKYRKLDKRVKIFINKKNIGLTNSLIKISKKVKGNFIVRLDSDDIALNNRLQIQLSWLQKSKKRVLVGSSASVIDEYDQWKFDINYKNKKHNEIVKELKFKNYFLHSTTMFRTDKFFQIGGYRKFFQYSQDYDLWCRLSKVGEIGVIVNKLNKVRVRPNSISIKKKILQDRYAVVSSYYFNNPKYYFHGDIKSVFNKINNHSNQHFKVLGYLYRKSIYQKYKVNFSNLSLSDVKYLLLDKKFFLIKAYKNVF